MPVQIQLVGLLEFAGCVSKHLYSCIVALAMVSLLLQTRDGSPQQCIAMYMLCIRQRLTYTAGPQRKRFTFKVIDG